MVPSMPSQPSLMGCAWTCLCSQRFPIESRGRRKKLREVGLVTSICAGCFSFRCECVRVRVHVRVPVHVCLCVCMSVRVCTCVCAQAEGAETCTCSLLCKLLICQGIGYQVSLSVDLAFMACIYLVCVALIASAGQPPSLHIIIIVAVSLL